MNGQERIQSGEQHGANPFLSVGVRLYPFTLEPSGSVFIPCFLQRITAETGGSSVNGYEPIRTEKNGFNPESNTELIRFSLLVSVRIRSRGNRLVPFLSHAFYNG